MPPRRDLRSILVLGSGPIVIGQACEFDYSGTQACKALRALGYRVVLVNSNPATIMTDPEVADATYVEPLLPEVVARVIERERPDALLPTVGGQTALNIALALVREGVLERFGVELIGARPEAIEVAEDRLRFKEAMEDIGFACPFSGAATTLEEALALLGQVGLPAIIRPAFTLGGEGGGVAQSREDFVRIVEEGLDRSPIRQVLVEESVLGWKEFELEVVRDLADRAVVVCSIENFDPMGVHTGDSITVAPAQTLSDVEYQRLRDMALAILRRVGVETGGSNVQFAVNPRTGAVRVIEMNPRVSRSSALASKATGFPIAKIAAQLAVGLTLDEITNEITGVTPASFEPALDYVVVKIPRWNFDKFPAARPVLDTRMRSVGEVMGIGGTFAEALLKAISSLEGGYADAGGWSRDEVRARLATPTPDRLPAVFEALRREWDPSEITALTGIDRWFLAELGTIVAAERALRGRFLDEVGKAELRRAKRLGMPDDHIARILGCTEREVAARRAGQGLHRVYKRVDTCAAEFASRTPYLYSTWGEEDEAGDEDRDRVVILGNGPNRIGQGLEFDYCCCHAAGAVHDAGLVGVMVNNNPETVSTDYDTSDKLYFEPITAEHVGAVLRREKPRGVILQFGGQTPLKLAGRVGPVLGTPPEAIDACEDRERFNDLCRRLGLRQPAGAIARTREEALAAARAVGLPVLLRPSYVLGGRGMVTCFSQADLERALDEAMRVSPDHPVLVDEFLEGAVEVDVDALSDGASVFVAAILEHVEEAGVHSGDSTTVIPPPRLSGAVQAEIRGIVERVARELGVVGLVNVQLAVRNGEVYVLEVNPRASRTVPFVSKATGLPLARLATRLCLGERLADLPLRRRAEGAWFVKAPVFPWGRFPGTDVVLGPEMRSTGEVMGVGWSLGEAMAKALLAAGMRLPTGGTAFLSLRDADKPAAAGIAGSLHSMGFSILATGGTARHLAAAGIPAERVYKVGEGSPDIVDRIRSGDVQLIINTPLGRKSRFDERALRLAGLRHGVPCLTTTAAGRAAVGAIRSLRAGELSPIKLQDLGPAGTAAEG